MTPNEFRQELLAVMPGYRWTVHQSRAGSPLSATGTQSSGFNRLSTLHVARREQDGCTIYTARSAGYGTRAPWLHTHNDGTLARALRGLQNHYEAVAATYRSHAENMKRGRVSEPSADFEPWPTGGQAVEQPQTNDLEATPDASAAQPETPNFPRER